MDWRRQYEAAKYTKNSVYLLTDTNVPMLLIETKSKFVY